MWPQIIILVISMAISYLNRPKPTTPKPAALSSVDLPVADEGTPQAVFFGDCWTGDWMVLSYGRWRTRKVKTKSGK